MTPGPNAKEGALTMAREPPEWLDLVGASSRLLERRRSQRGAHTPGDAFDEAVVEALARVRLAPAGAAPRASDVEALGLSLGRDVYARRMFEDSFPAAFATLSTTLMASGLGTLHLEDAFHRTASARFLPLPGRGFADEGALTAYLTGALKGFLGDAFNCDVRVSAGEGLAFEVSLGEGRDVNRRRAA